MFSGLLIIPVPLVVGYLIPLRRQATLGVISQLLGQMVYLILFFMGVSLTLFDNPASNLLAIPHYSAVSTTVILLCNIAALMWLEQGLLQRNHHQQEKLPSRIAMALESLKLCSAVVIDSATGLSGLAFLRHTAETSEYTLILLLSLVGAQLCSNDMALEQIVFNHRGMIVVVVVVASSLIGGLINASILDLPINTALTVVSGLGWYSLPGISLTESFGPVAGSAAFFNDLTRELTAIMLVPGLIHHSHSAALGLCGITSVDFTLPVLQRIGGLDTVPVAIVHGSILSPLVPVPIASSSA